MRDCPVHSPQPFSPACCRSDDNERAGGNMRKPTSIRQVSEGPQKFPNLNTVIPPSPESPALIEDERRLSMVAERTIDAGEDCYG